MFITPEDGGRGDRSLGAAEGGVGCKGHRGGSGRVGSG